MNGTLTRYLYDQEDIIALFSGPANCQTHAVLHGPGIDQPLAFVKDTNADCHPFNAVGLPIVTLQQDGLGSTTSLISETGGFVRSLFLAERYVYDSFGNPTIQAPDGTPRTTSAFGNPYLFTGREYDPESGLYYYRARYYDPRMGRFLQEDPIRGFLEIPLTQHQYSYVINNPVNRIDPKGKLSASIVAAIVGGVVTLTFVALFVLGTRKTIEKANQLRKQQASCDPEKALEADERFRELVEEEAVPKVKLGIAAASVSQASTPEGQALFLGQETGTAIGEVIEGRKRR